MALYKLPILGFLITPYLQQAETQARQILLCLSQIINAKQPSQGRKRR